MGFEDQVCLTKQEFLSFFFPGVVPNRIVQYLRLYFKKPMSLTRCFQRLLWGCAKKWYCFWVWIVSVLVGRVCFHCKSGESLTKKSQLAGFVKHPKISREYLQVLSHIKTWRPIQKTFSKIHVPLQRFHLGENIHLINYWDLFQGISLFHLLDMSFFFQHGPVETFYLACEVHRYLKWEVFAHKMHQKRRSKQQRTWRDTCRTLSSWLHYVITIQRQLAKTRHRSSAAASTISIHLQRQSRTFCPFYFTVKGRVTPPTPNHQITTVEQPVNERQRPSDPPEADRLLEIKSSFHILNKTPLSSP